MTSTRVSVGDEAGCIACRGNTANARWSPALYREITTKKRAPLLLVGVVHQRNERNRVLTGGGPAAGQQDRRRARGPLVERGHRLRIGGADHLLWRGARLHAL